MDKKNTEIISQNYQIQTAMSASQISPSDITGRTEELNTLHVTQAPRG